MYVAKVECMHLHAFSLPCTSFCCKGHLVWGLRVSYPAAIWPKFFYGGRTLHMGLVAVGRFL